MNSRATTFLIPTVLVLSFLACGSNDDGKRLRELERSRYSFCSWLLDGLREWQGRVDDPTAWKIPAHAKGRYFANVQFCVPSFSPKRAFWFHYIKPKEVADKWLAQWIRLLRNEGYGVRKSR